MVNRITDKQKEEAWRMYKQGGIINNIAKYVSVSYHSAWVMTKGRKRGFKTITEYQEHLAQEKGFKTFTEYKEHLAQKRIKRQGNIELKNLIHSYLNKLWKNQSWLAEQIGVSRQAVSLYASGKIIPKYETLDKLFNILKVKRKPRSLCDFVKEM